MRQIATISLLILAAAGFVTLAGGAGETPAGKEFKVELDNAFGLIEQGDFKIAGVRAGEITELELDPKTKHALVGFKVTEDGFGSLRTDATCNVAPQSLVGEYYVDCQPGKNGKKLEEGATIPVERTTSTVPPDLVNNILRLPYRQRLRLIVGELGAAVAGNADNLNAAIRRAVPALRETNRVLAILAKQNQILAGLARDGDTVIGELAAKKDDISRFVVDAKELSQSSAERDREIAAGFRRLPTFLRELRPTMTELRATVDEQGPALRNVAQSAPQIERLFENLPPLAKASGPAIRSLGEASVVGRDAVRKAGSTVTELDRYSRGVPELGRNLAIILEHLDDRDFSAEEDPRSPGGEGYTGLEAVLQYVFDQAMSTNIHDGLVNILAVVPHVGVCAQYADIKRAKERAKECASVLGPNQVGITFPDATAPNGYDGSDRGPGGADGDPVQPNERRTRRVRPDDEVIPPDERDDGAARRDGDRPGASSSRPQAPAAPPAQLPKLDDILRGGGGMPEPPKAPGVPKLDPPPGVPDAGKKLPLSNTQRRYAGEQFLAFLLGS